LDEWDELGFDSAFADVSTRDILDGDLYSSSLGDALPNSLPSMGLGITPPNTFAFAEDFLENKKNQNKKKQQSADGSLKPLTSTSSSSSSGSSTSRPIGIPGSSSSSLVGGNHPRVSVGLGLHTDPNKDKNQNFVGAYSPESRRKRIEKFLDKRQKRVWRKEVKYDVRKNFADSRLRVKGRFVKKEDEQLLRELLSFT
jgi:hypothetical protein